MVQFSMSQALETVFLKLYNRHDTYNVILQVGIIISNQRLNISAVLITLHISSFTSVQMRYSKTCITSFPFTILEMWNLRTDTCQGHTETSFYCTYSCPQSTHSSNYLVITTSITCKPSAARQTYEHSVTVTASSHHTLNILLCNR